MSNTTDASAVNKKSRSESSTPLLILAYFVFRSKVSYIDNLMERFKILPMGSTANFEYLAEEWKRDHKFDGCVKTCIFTPEETNVNSIQSSVKKLAEVAMQYSQAPNVSKVEIRVFVPHSCSISMSLAFFRHYLGVQEQHFYLQKYLGTKVDVENSKIKLLEYSELPLAGISKINANDSIIEDIPTSKDAQTAAILCEYAYALVRKYNDENKKGIPIIRKVLMRDSSDAERHQNTVTEIAGLSIMPSSWKTVLGIGNECIEYNSGEQGRAQYQRLGLEDWDAISIDTIVKKKNGGWFKMSSVEKEWNGSLSQKIVEKLNKRFSLIGNKGVLNTWFGMSKNSGFASIIYVNETSRTVMYCTVGSDFGKDILFNGDWTTTNVLQFLTGLSPQYQQSVTNAKILDEVIDSINAEKEQQSKGKVRLFFIGHSLGGGLASNNAIITSGRHAITFNAAGLNWLRVPISLMKNRPSQLLHPFKRKERVHLFVIKGEILDMVQSYVSPTPWLLNSINMDLPGKARAYSSPHTRKEIAPSEKVVVTAAPAKGKSSKSTLAPVPKVERKMPSAIDRHSLINFMVPPNKIEEIQI